MQGAARLKMGFFDSSPGGRWDLFLQAVLQTKRKSIMMKRALAPTCRSYVTWAM